MKIKDFINQTKSEWDIPEIDPDKILPKKPPRKKILPEKERPCHYPSRPEKFPEIFPEYIEPPRPWPKRGDDDDSSF